MIDFPASPTNAQIFYAPNGVAYQWNSTYTAWLPVQLTSPGGGDFFALYKGAAVGVPTTPATFVFNTVSSGNSGGWYSTSTGRFTPPAGRYHIYSSFAYSMTVTGTNTSVVVLRKNGVAITSSLATAYPGGGWNPGYVSANVDANGTDYFDVQSYVTGGTFSYNDGAAWFGAFPIPSGIPVAPAVGVPWRSLGIVNPSNVASVDFQNIPPDINHLQFVLGALTPAVNDGLLQMEFYDGTGALNTVASYATTGMITGTAQAMGAAPATYTSNGQTFMHLCYNAASNQVGSGAVNGGWQGFGMISNIKQTAGRKNVVYQGSYVLGSGAQMVSTSGMGTWTSTGTNMFITGLRFYFSTGNIASGTVELWGSP